MPCAAKTWAALAALAASLLAGCHTVHQCPILQGMTGGRIPSPLPRDGDSYDVVGYRDGVRFYVIRYDDKLYRSGDILEREGMGAVKALGVWTIVSATPRDAERAWAREMGLEYVELPFGWHTLERADLDRFLAVMDSAAGPVLVKSYLGINQAGILAAYWRVQRQGWSVKKALDEFYRLDGNYWDSVDMIKVMKQAAAECPPEVPRE